MVGRAVVDRTDRGIDEGGFVICGDAISLVDVAKNVVFGFNPPLDCGKELDTASPLFKHGEIPMTWFHKNTKEITYFKVKVLFIVQH